MTGNAAVVMAVVAMAAGYLWAAGGAGPGAAKEEAAAAPGAKSRLAVIWTSGDPGVAHNVCFMYTGNAAAQKWFDEVVLVVWGPSAKLLAEDASVEASLREMMKRGVTVQACVACANKYGVADKLRAMGIEVKGMGVPLTEMLKGDWKVLTF